MRHFMFYDHTTGEEFIVGAYTLTVAEIIASDYFADPAYQYEMTEYEAEMSGLDEY